MGEAKRRALARPDQSVTLDTFGGRVHVEWDPAAAVTPLGQLPFFIEFLKVSGLFEAWVADCPLTYHSHNASDKRAVLATFLLSILAGHRRYAHITGIRHDGIQPELLGVTQLVSEDAARRALKRLEETAGVAWLDRHLAKTTRALLSTPWILDLDTTVKCLYGKQEGAVVGYNPHKPGRPSHCYHSALMANTRLALTVEVMAGNETAPRHRMPGIWAWLDSLPPAERPALLRGDVAYGSESVMREAEAREQPYLSKLRLTKRVKGLVQKVFRSDDWADPGQGWEGLDDTLTLSGWSRARRVVVLGRKLTGELLLTGKDALQDQFAFLDFDVPTARYEYAVLVTSTAHEIIALAQLYRDRADAENNFDELKNQWGWGGFTTHDLKRCQFTAMTVALAYNWWSLFVRLANPKARLEAITSRPFLLSGIGRLTTHAGQSHRAITAMHGKAEKAKTMLKQASRRLQEWKVTAEQLTSTSIISVWHCVCAFIMTNVTGVNWLDTRRPHALPHCTTGQ